MPGLDLFKSRATSDKGKQPASAGANSNNPAKATDPAPTDEIQRPSSSHSIKSTFSTAGSDYGGYGGEFGGEMDTFYSFGDDSSIISDLEPPMPPPPAQKPSGGGLSLRFKSLSTLKADPPHDMAEGTNEPVLESGTNPTHDSSAITAKPAPSPLPAANSTPTATYTTPTTATTLTSVDQDTMAMPPPPPSPARALQLQRTDSQTNFARSDALTFSKNPVTPSKHHENVTPAQAAAENLVLPYMPPLDSKSPRDPAPKQVTTPKHSNRSGLKPRLNPYNYVVGTPQEDANINVNKAADSSEMSVHDHETNSSVQTNPPITTTTATATANFKTPATKQAITSLVTPEMETPVPSPEANSGMKFEDAVTFFETDLQKIHDLLHAGETNLAELQTEWSCAYSSVLRERAEAADLVLELHQKLDDAMRLLNDFE